MVPGADTDRIAVPTPSSAIVVNEASGLQNRTTAGFVNTRFPQQVSVEGRDGVVVGVDPHHRDSLRDRPSVWDARTGEGGNDVLPV
ncbi:hypothetical protein MSTO_61020 [Mycobacterium stomatepiae]|uniref:Uncharacterized protein n=1 Tax=Mycobacterium stomatepiae TaxID=470076 RepID=A0A7I7QII5_9MYCO|nr:hypothetical protein MSTO_61020 [Mycobacterium stomatepiae]